MKKQGLTLDDMRAMNNLAFRWAAANGHLEILIWLKDQGLTLSNV